MSENSNPDELRGEYDFTPEQLLAGVREKYADRYAEGVNLVRLDPDVAVMFPDSASVNEARVTGRSRSMLGPESRDDLDPAVQRS